MPACVRVGVGVAWVLCLSLRLRPPFSEIRVFLISGGGSHVCKACLWTSTLAPRPHVVFMVAARNAQAFLGNTMLIFDTVVKHVEELNFATMTMWLGRGPVASHGAHLPAQCGAYHYQ